MNLPNFVTRLFIVLLAVSLLNSCANRQRRSADSDGATYDPYAGTDPYANPNGSGYAEDIPLTGRPDGVDFYGSNVNRNLFSAIYFGFDQYDISQNEWGTVQEVADYLRSNPDKLIIAGHTDEAGTAEYNRNLGELRALSVRAALSDLGVAADRIQTVSYGEDQVAQAGNDPANRRAEFGFYK